MESIADGLEDGKINKHSELPAESHDMATSLLSDWPFQGTLSRFELQGRGIACVLAGRILRYRLLSLVATVELEEGGGIGRVFGLEGGGGSLKGMC